ncbi:MAG: histidine phosphatase family protein [Rickettsiella sp.]|nr:histidine phosphatase family protein [Rickettsiella sp.]
MITLTLIRHATAHSKQICQQDSNRMLNPLGEQQAKNIALQLTQKNYLPDYILCSPTKRTLQTATILCQTLELSTQLIKTDNILYSGDVEEILAHVCCLTNAKQLFLVGHNPNLSWLAHYLCNATKSICLPPAGVIGLEFKIKSWDELTKTSGKLLFFIEPSHELH